MNDILTQNASAIERICKTHRVRQLDVFGSVLSEDFGDNSDIDFLVEFERDGYGGAFEQFMGLKEDLEELLSRPVDLIVNRPFRNPFFQREIDQTKQVIYAA
jgi:predicted nucleotidyltransferase